MIGYIFRADNRVTGKTYIGKNLSVAFDNKYIGNNPGVISDAEKYGADSFIVKMIRACETVKECDMAYDFILNDVKAVEDKRFYNYTGSTEDVPAKKTRKKKAIIDE